MVAPDEFAGHFAAIIESRLAPGRDTDGLKHLCNDMAHLLEGPVAAYNEPMYKIASKN